MMHYNRWRMTGDPGPVGRLNRKNDPDALTKECAKCGVVKPKTDFTRDPRTNDRCWASCKRCVALVARNSRFKKKYGITADEYDEMLKSQNGGCRICGAQRARRALVVDHCHDTGKVRGILCNNCNALLGMAEDDVHRLAAAITYLEKSRR
jgi:hypothetical protein